MLVLSVVLLDSDGKSRIDADGPGSIEESEPEFRFCRIGVRESGSIIGINWIGSIQGRVERGLEAVRMLGATHATS